MPEFSRVRTSGMEPPALASVTTAIAFVALLVVGTYFAGPPGIVPPPPPVSESGAFEGASSTAAPLLQVPGTVATYVVAFTEAGLYQGTNWTISLNGTPAYSSTETIQFFEPNGSYSYDASSVKGYVIDHARGSVVVAGRQANVTILFRSIAGPRTITNVTVGKAPGPAAAAVGLSGSGWVYVPDNLSDEVSVFNGTTLVATVTVGAHPTDAVYDPYNGFVYVVNWGSHNVSVISGTTVIGSINVGTNPRSAVLAVAPPGPPVSKVYIYVANIGSANVTVISNMTVVATLGVGQWPVAMAVNASNGRVYVANYASKNLSIIDGTQVLASVGLSGTPYSLLWNPTNGYIYEVDAGNANVTVIAGTTVVTTIAVPGQGDNILAFDWATGGVYVLTQGTPPPNYGNRSDVSLIHGTALIGTVLVAGAAVSAIWDDSNQLLYVSAAQVYIFDGPSIIDTIKLGGPLSPGLLGFDVDSGNVYCSDFNASSISTTVSVIAPAPYAANFTESGLPPGSSWSVDLSGVLRYSNGTALIFGAVSNGTYRWSASALGYRASPSGGTVIVKGANVTVAMTFQASSAPPMYPVTFTESGLPASARWSVTVNGSSNSSSGTRDTFQEANGSYGYLVSNAGSYQPNPASGSVLVSGSAIGIAIQFTHNSSGPPPRHNVTFRENGLPNGTTWSVDLNGSTENTSSTRLVFSKPNGTYPWTANTTVNGMFESMVGNTTVRGSDVQVNLSLWPPSGLFTLDFEEAGLATGTKWSVTLTATASGLWIESAATATRSSVGSATIRFQATPGRYAFAAAAAGYSTVGGVIEVLASSTAPVRIAFSALAPGGSQSPTVLGLAGSTFGVGIAFLLIGTLGLTATWYRSRLQRRTIGRRLVARLADSDWELEAPSSEVGKSR